MENVITLEGITKYYGKHPGVIDLNLQVKTGEVFGYLGPNGAGKTTTIRIMLDLLRPTQGKVSIYGLDAQTESRTIKYKIGYVPAEPALYKHLNGHDLLKYLANIRGGVDWDHVTDLTNRFDCDLSRPINTLSRGNKQKIAIIRALMHKPALLILDEPTTGLDPLMQLQFYDLLLMAKNQGTTIFLSSHILHEVEHLADRVGIIRDGRLITLENIESLRSREFRKVEIEFADQVSASDFTHLNGLRNLEFIGNRLFCEIDGGLDPLIKAVSHYTVINFQTHDPDLEEIFLRYYGGGAADAG